MDDCEEISPLDAVLTQEPMIDIDESTYEQLSGRDLSPADKMILVRCCCKLDPSYGRLKEKIIQELFFQTVSFSVEGGLDLGGVSILLKLVERELQYLMVRDPETLLFAGGESPEQGKLRFRANVAELVSEKQMPVSTMKRVTGYYTRFLQQSSLYQYVLQQSPAEIEVGVDVMIETPAIPLPLSS